MTEKWTPEELKLNFSNKRQPLCKRTGKGSKAKPEIEMALKKAREIIDKFNEFDVFCEACEMADYMVTEILDIGLIKFSHKPTSEFWVKVREHIRLISKSNGRNW